MKHLIGILVATTLIGTSLASTTPNRIEENKKRVVSVTQQKTVTRSALVRVKVQKPKLFTGKPHNTLVSANDWDDDFLDIDDVITTYRRRDLNKIEHPEGISDRVRWRLFLARQLAMLKYKELHS